MTDKGPSTASLETARLAFYTGKGLAVGDMNEQHIIDAFAAALAEAVRQEREADCAAICWFCGNDNTWESTPVQLPKVSASSIAAWKHRAKDDPTNVIDCQAGRIRARGESKS